MVTSKKQGVRIISTIELESHNVAKHHFCTRDFAKIVMGVILITISKFHFVVPDVLNFS